MNISICVLRSEVDEHGMQPLHMAAAYNQLEIIKYLSVHVVDLDAETKTGYTALQLAAQNNFIGCLKVGIFYRLCKILFDFITFILTL